MTAHSSLQGSIVASVSIAALVLPFLSASHWVARSCWISSLVTGLLAVYFSNGLAWTINQFPSESHLRAWILDYATMSPGTYEDPLWLAIRDGTDATSTLVLRSFAPAPSSATEWVMDCTSRGSYVRTHVPSGMSKRASTDADGAVAMSFVVGDSPYQQSREDMYHVLGHGQCRRLRHNHSLVSVYERIYILTYAPSVNPCVCREPVTPSSIAKNERRGVHLVLLQHPLACLASRHLSLMHR